ncbi:MAG: hypothetical protein J6N52_11620 [Clostridia bacterium]|nr:hypothetical protein [Clostridia bacterium]
MKDNKCAHEGHKKRLREKFAINNDFTGFYDHEILEILLNYANVRQNTNGIAHALIDRFHSLDGVFDATREQLMEVPGVGEYTATLILIQHALFGIYNRRKYDMKRRSFDDRDSLFPYICSLFAGAKKEMIYMLCISKSGKITNTCLISRGNDESVMPDNREIIKIAINNEASGLIFAHNHLTGITTPSNYDIESTKLLSDGLKHFGITLIDHFIVVGNHCESMMNDRRFKLLK